MASPTKRRRAEVPPPAVVEDEVTLAALHEKPVDMLVMRVTMHLMWVAKAARRVAVGPGGSQVSVLNFVVSDGATFTQVVL